MPKFQRWKSYFYKKSKENFMEIEKQKNLCGKKDNLKKSVLLLLRAGLRRSYQKSLRGKGLEFPEMKKIKI